MEWFRINFLDLVMPNQLSQSKLSWLLETFWDKPLTSIVPIYTVYLYDMHFYLFSLDLL